MSLFIKEGNSVVLNHTEVLLIKSFKTLYDKDTTEGKARSYKCFAFIYFYADYRSPYIEKEEEERRKKAAHESYLDTDDYDYTNDKDFWLAVADYENLRTTPIQRQAINIKRTIETSSKAVNLINNRISNYLNTIESVDITTLQGDDLIQHNIMLDSIYKQIDQVFVFAAKIEKNSEIIEKVEERIKKQQTQEVTLAGNQKGGNRMD